MYCGADTAVTVRPMYPADGRKIPDIYAAPEAWRATLTRDLGPFPLFNFWGPMAGIASSAWIAEAALRVMAADDPTITLVYLPHLDYPLQKLGPNDPAIAAELRAVDALCGRLIDAARARDAAVVVLSEYGITAVRRPVHLNRALREAGLLTIRDEMGQDKLDAGASAAVAVADHQVAHIHVHDPDRIPAVRAVLERVPGVAAVLDQAGKEAAGLDHPRSGELVALAEPDAWFTYYFWLDDRLAPDYARTVDIHRKPGYDPVELFLDPALKHPRLAVGWRLLKRRAGLRTLLDVIPLDAGLVRGSHGLAPADPNHGAVMICSDGGALPAGGVPATAVRDLLLERVF
jgi:predicted AlkP superfamily pyrophosphatase or phosphodiesterase